MRRLRDKPKVCLIHYYAPYGSDIDNLQARAWWATGRYVEDVTFHLHAKKDKCPGTCRIFSPLAHLPSNFGRMR